MELAEDKKNKRKENKKRKIAAFLAVAELNDADKSKKKKKEDTATVDDENDNSIDNITKSKELVTKYSSNSCTAVTDKPMLEGDAYEELKKRLRERKKAMACIPLFRLKPVGQDASLSLSKRIPLFMSDIQHLLLYSMMGDKAPYQPYRWCTLMKWNRLSNMVVLVMEGLGLEDYNNNYNQLGWIRKHVPNLVEIMSPSSYQSSVVEELTLLPLTVMHKDRLIKEFGSLESACENEEAFKAFRSIFPIKRDDKSKKKDGKTDSLKLQLLLSVTQMVTDNYPLPLTGKLGDRYADYKFSKEEYKEVSEDSPMFSLDCEMCLTDAGHELTRVCLVDHRLAVVYHTLVKPKHKIRNYLTQYSGITSDMLENVTTTLEDVQKALQELLPQDAILIGQSLNFDLVSLKLFHPYVVDTSVCFNITGDRRKKTKLSVLTQLFLNRSIQTHGKEGHNPIEDAQAAMSLVNLKLDKGLSFGDAVLGGEVPSMNEEGQYVMSSNKDHLDRKDSLMTSLSKTLADHEKTVALVCDNSVNEKYENFANFKSSLKLFDKKESSKEALEAATTAAVEHNMTICHVNINDDNNEDLDEETKVKRLKKFTKKMYEHTSVNGMFMLILSGTKNQNSVAGVIVKKPEADS